MYSLINLLSWITVKRVYMVYLGQKIISNFLTKPGFHMVNINRYIFEHELGPAVCYHEFNAFEELNKYHGMQIAYYLTLTTHIQVVCPHWMI